MMVVVNNIDYHRYLAVAFLLIFSLLSELLKISRNNFLFKKHYSYWNDIKQIEFRY